MSFIIDLDWGFYYQTCITLKDVRIRNCKVLFFIIDLVWGFCYQTCKTLDDVRIRNCKIWKPILLWMIIQATSSNFAAPTMQALIGTSLLGLYKTQVF